MQKRERWGLRSLKDCVGAALPPQLSPELVTRRSGATESIPASVRLWLTEVRNPKSRRRWAYGMHVTPPCHPPLGENSAKRPRLFFRPLAIRLSNTINLRSPAI